MEMGLPLEEQPENVWANTRWAWTGLRKTHHNVGKVNKNSRYSAGDWQWADGIIPGQSYRIVSLFSYFLQLYLLNSSNSDYFKTTVLYSNK